MASDPKNPKQPLRSEDDFAIPDHPLSLDDDSIDLGKLEPVEEGGSALSFSGKAEPKTGGSGSGVRSWEQLVRESAAEPGAEHVEQGAVAPADDIDPISDKDLLREVLADEPPPSNIIMKDPSAGELPALKAESNDPSFSSFVLPPDLAATRPGDSSVLGHAPPAGSFTSDVWGSSSDVDLLRPSNSSSGLLQPTDEVANPPLAQPASGDSSKALGDAPLPGAESSAVDLGAHSAVDLPFPLGVDSTVGPASRRSHAHIDSPDSGTVDLMAAGEEFDVGLSDSTTSPSWAAAREDLPPTVPMVPAKARLMAWAGGGGAGLLVGVAACAVLWWAGVVPNQSAKPVASVPAADTSRYQAQVQAAEQARDDAAKKAEAETANAKRLTNQVAVLTTQSQKAASAVTQAKQARDRAAVLAAEVKDLEARQALLKQTSDKLATDKSTADAKAREAEAALANLRDRMAKAETDAKVAQDRADEASASLAAVQKKSAAATAEIARRLRLAPNASSAEMLAALDQALAGPATGEPPSTTVASRPPVALPPASPITNSVQASQASWSGIAAYRTGNAAAAERDFARLAASPEANAITFYFLGLSQRRQGHYAESEESFRRGWELEKSSRPSPAEVEAVFERLPPADRDAVNRHRR